MIEITNKTKFDNVIADAIAKTADSYRWQNAVKKAVREIEENGAFMNWDSEADHLLIWSQGSNQIYTANGTCQCKAYNQGYPCFHRAASRLVKNYLKADEKTPVNSEQLPYIKQLNGTPERLGNIRF